MILYLKNLKNFTKKLTDNINLFNKVAEYKINLQKSVAFLYINNKQTEIEFKKIIPLTISLKISLGICQNKEVKELYNEN
jgi:hypothetical protein